MLFITTENFYCNELNRLVRAGEAIDLTPEQAKGYRGMVRQTAMAAARIRRAKNV